MKMKRQSIILILMVFIISIMLTSASLFDTPNFSAARNVLDNDLSGYYDYLISDCKLPDGKIANVYVFNNIYDQMQWQWAQARAYSSIWKKSAAKEIKRCEEKGTDSSFYRWYPTGPLSPFYKRWGDLEKIYGADETNKICIATSPVMYYKQEDLGQLSNYLKTLDCAAQACYEDENGVYLITICRTKYIPQSYIVSNKMKILHKNEFVYEVAFIPKEMYKDEPLKLDPAKTTIYDPDSVPDSDLELVPVEYSGNENVYYYDSTLAYKLQWLAVNVACKGVYDMAYTGNFYAKNPKDNYKTSFIKSYLASNNGKTSRGTILFEGICFDYADFACQEIKANKKEYPNVVNYWMVGTFENPNDIIVYKIASPGEKSNMTINTTPVVVLNHNRIVAHENATNHAWLWVQSDDGTVYWVDPTWTDNLGQPVYGIVRDGREIPLNPDTRLFAK